jgi:hypothetical protein
MHVRVLVSVPLLLVAEELLEIRCRAAVDHVRAEGVAARASLDVILDRAERLRDSRLVEAGIAIVVLALGQAALWDLGGWSGFASGRARELGLSFGTIWCFAIALPLIQFLILRWLWRWLLWAYVLARMSRLSLSLNAIHPDKAAGLRPLSNPIDAFAVFLAAIMSIAAAAWSTQILDHHASLPSIAPTFFAVFVVAVVVACGPLLLFSAELYRARHRDGASFHGLAREYVDEFRHKWIGVRPYAPLLGTPDFQALNDLGGSLERTEATRLYPFGVRAIISLWAGALAPMLPLIVATTPIAEVATKFGKMLFGVAP